MTAIHKISLLVPCFNASKYINNFIDHLVKANLKFDEVIFYNDGSTDDTLVLLKSSGFKYLTSDTNSGPGYARNRLAEITTCEYIHFHDVDDLIDPTYLIEIRKSLSSDYDVIFCDADWIDATTGDTIIKWKYKNDSFKKDGTAYVLRTPIGGINGTYKKKTLLDLGGFDENLKIWEDADLNFRFALYNKNIFFTEKVLVTSLRYGKSTSNNDGNIRKYKYLFLNKYIHIDEPILRQELIKQTNRLFHETVSEKDELLYPHVKQLGEKLNVKIPLTSNILLNTLKLIIGPKLYTQLKCYLLKKIY